MTRAATLQELTVDKSTVYRRCLPGGPWQRLLPGIILLENSPPTLDQQLTAALLYGGPGALITGVHACRRQGLRLNKFGTTARDPEKIHILIPHTHRVESSGFVLVERTRRMPRSTYIDGVPVAPVRRAALDAARRLRADEPVANLLFEAMQRGHCTPGDLRAELDIGGQRGTAIPRRILGEITHLRSVAELDAKRLTAAMSRPPTHWNVKLFSPDGRYIATPDAWWDDVGLAWEIDSAEFHFSRDAYDRTVKRNSRYGQASVPVVQTLPSELRGNPSTVRSELEAAYRAASELGRPRVRIVGLGSASGSRGSTSSGPEFPAA
ncbi:hypothetical protein [Prauserella alba]|uniref:Transcriptional regulator, AbiEi antitoxin, Type IV TA system n=1 Tax=Prauserella alba TaxID=176898 RepID=A0ABN1V6E1_9PSEU|nr:hypothetical protein [Prauserella alba]